MNMVTSWRAVLWCAVAVSAISRQYESSEDAVNRADKILKSFDERFMSDGHQLIEKGKKA